MPLFMDRHDLPGLTAEGIAEAHQMDLSIQTQYGCNAMTYWVDSDRGYVFCLIDAPSIQAVIEMHNNSHGSIPHEIREVNSELVNSFLGRIHDPQPEPEKKNDSLLVITETAFRAIMITDICDKLLLASQYSYEIKYSILQTFHEQIRKLAEEYQGSIVDNQNEYILSFISVSNAVDCAIAFHEFYRNHNLSATNKIIVRTGISAGIPVTENAKLFGDTIRTAENLSMLSVSGIVNISAKIRDMYKGQYPDKMNTSTVRYYSPNEEDFLNKLMDAIHQSISMHEFKLDDISKKLSLSKSNLYRKIVSLTGFSPVDFIMEIRLRKAIECMQTKNSNISETSYELGFSNPSYFSKCFKKRFGILPADFLKSLA